MRDVGVIRFPSIPHSGLRSSGESFFRVMSPKWQSLVEAMAPFRVLDSAAVEDIKWLIPPALHSVEHWLCHAADRSQKQGHLLCSNKPHSYPLYQRHAVLISTTMSHILIGRIKVFPLYPLLLNSS